MLATLWNRALYSSFFVHMHGKGSLHEMKRPLKSGDGGDALASTILGDY